ncbi:hypothetical protein ACFQAT_27490 [Undibacterium arcticum]|uniref:Transposase n=1 Tax=Undibacterium arcticum TaxID=1762892 RepID=A0ABV7EVD1_9BURK
MRLLARPNPEVVALMHRRKFCAAEKYRILNLADNCTSPGDIGAPLRREGISSPHLARWRRHRKNIRTGHGGRAKARRYPAKRAGQTYGVEYGPQDFFTRWQGCGLLSWSMSNNL